MPHPNIKRLRSAKYSNSINHYSMLNSVTGTKRSPQWNQIITNKEKLDKRVDKDILVAGGTQHTLGNAVNDGAITIESNNKQNKKLTIANQSLNINDASVFVGAKNFKVTNTSMVWADKTGAAFDITPDGNNPDDLELVNMLDQLKIDDIFTVTGGIDDTGNGNKDETWINNTYRLEKFIEKDAADAITYNATDNAAVAGKTRIGFFINPLAANATGDLTNDSANNTSDVPSALGNIRLKKNILIKKYRNTANDGDLFYLE
tara:strand:+ start:3057 stop:3839 length:783 start_codon:yes stop_codon:yes gene_type:complete